jgi:hypothetical protein
LPLSFLSGKSRYRGALFLFRRAGGILGMKKHHAIWRSAYQQY